MTRTYAAKRLLEHGPLTFAEFVEVTGWGHDRAGNTIKSLMCQGVIFSSLSLGNRRPIYSLAD